jgi:hypothetical protein
LPIPSSIRRTGAAALAAAALIVICPAPPAIAAPGPAQIRDYDLGVVELPDAGAKGPIPVRLWGAIGVPDGQGPVPLVVVAHGRHGDDCRRLPGRAVRFSWPCWKRELRSDLGMRHLVEALAERGVAAIAPDLNGAFTIGWNDRSGERHRKLWPAIVDRTLAELAAANAGTGAFGLPLGGRLDLSDPGVLAHSLSGADAVRYANRHSVPALLLLAPAFDRGLTLPDIPTAIVAARCDYDVPGQARRYLDLAERSGRGEPLFFVRLEGASHNYFNSTLSRLGRDDGRYLLGSNGCHRLQRLSATRQQGWADRFAAAFFATELRGAAAPDWMRPGAGVPRRIYGLPVGYDRLP